MDRPIGIFDSGVGGLTVAREIFQSLPFENIVYFGDTAHLPYGSKSEKAVNRFSIANTRFLLTKKIKILVVACNTASALSLSAIRKLYPLPVIGVITPGVEKAIEVTKGYIGVIGTEATIRSGSYQREIKSRCKSIRIKTQACPLLVPLVEEGWYKDKITREIVKRYLEPLKKDGIDTLILGCTHYPLLKGIFLEVLGDNVKLVDSAVEIAQKVVKALNKNGLKRKGTGPGYRHFFASDLHERFIRVGEFFLGEKMKNVKEINLENYYA